LIDCTVQLDDTQRIRVRLRIHDYIDLFCKSMTLRIIEVLSFEAKKAEAHEGRFGLSLNF
jgi:hypothetical protein